MITGDNSNNAQGIELDRDQAQRHAQVLINARASWFYDYHFSAQDYAEYEEALLFFDGIRKQLKHKSEVK